MAVLCRIIEQNNDKKLNENTWSKRIDTIRQNYCLMVSSSKDKNWNSVPGIPNPQREIQNPRLSWISL